MSKVSQKVLDTISLEAQRLAESTGLAAQGVTVKKVEYVKEAGLWYLRVTLHKATGVSIKDCETLHRPLSKRLDELDPIPDAYYLEVSSEGIAPDSDTACEDCPAPANSLAEEKRNE